MVFGATANFIAVWLVSWTGSVYSVSAFTAVSGIIGFIATLFLKDHSNEALSRLARKGDASTSDATPSGIICSAVARTTYIQ